jgi:transcriptional regulator with GAF, ATPase, and Fis domain
MEVASPQPTGAPPSVAQAAAFTRRTNAGFLWSGARPVASNNGMTPVLDPIAGIDSRTVAGVLSEVAEIASETLELRDVFPRVATAVRRVLPFDKLGVVRIVDGDRVIHHATTVEHAPADDSSDPLYLSAWSPRWRPHAGPMIRLGDARVELDLAFPMDAKVVAAGVRSALWEPFRAGSTFAGGVWLCSFEPHVYSDEHQEVLRPIAALLGSAVEHWRIWDRERRRNARLNAVEGLQRTLAGSLDVRQVFQALSDELQSTLPHDMMVLTELGLRERTLRIVAASGGYDIPIPPTGVTLTSEECEVRADHEVIRDIPAHFKARTERERLILASGLRSWLRVPVRLAGGEVSGGLSFFHREPARFSEEDAEVAGRVADRIALSLSFHRLAEEARVAAEASERAERLEATVETLSRELEARGRGRVVGRSPMWKEILRAVGRVAASETTVLVTGESGTGKEVISKLVHEGSPRNGKPFVAINCAALPEQLLESELFGHEKGAFTGAVSTKIGRLEQAAGGTLFLDEIAEMSPQVQAKFLRVLEEREFQRLGGTRTLKADVRVIAATNRDLGAAIARQAFREDLFYRLNVFTVHISPLRERPEDILPLAEAFLDDLGRSMGRPAAGISRDAREWLLAHPWPGNVRELRNAIERAILLCDGGLITRMHLPQLQVRLGTTAADVNGGSNRDHGAARVHAPDDLNLDVVERGLVVEALTKSEGNKSKAARLLGLSRAQLYSRIEKYRLD